MLSIDSCPLPLVGCLGFFILNHSEIVKSLFPAPVRFIYLFIFSCSGGLRAGFGCFFFFLLVNLLK